MRHTGSATARRLAAASGVIALAFLTWWLVARGTRGAQIAGDVGAAASVVAAAAALWTLMAGRGLDDAEQVPQSTWRRAWRRASVVITAPAADDCVPHQVTVRGTAARIPDGGTIWLVVRAGRSYYPQGKIHVPISGAGSWIQTVYFGSANGSAGHEYMLLAEGADRAASSRFEIYMRQKAARQDAEPLSDAKGTYPKTATLAVVNVIRSP